ncbi:MAG: bifunctional DNA-formamidopyrimidine glycosylase/DNA-(apurinic or apyrimidinic site) lyase [Spirochaetes bacterium]|nr:bifunctional DNA-formamidopyrimidine glycosylase/DNA-(apurinic or apyrimidinic site) lyase [Spirochaetota bacterium]
MPELPEVETVRRSLKPLIGQTFERITLCDGKLRFPVAKDCGKAIAETQLQSIDRQGKYLIFRFPQDNLVMHLGMTGRLLIRQKQESPYARVLFYFNRDRLDFIDTRRFGFILHGAAAMKALPTGQDALGITDTVVLFERLKKSRADIKALLLNQNILAGLGNIYASEILFAAGVHPQKRGIDLTTDAIRRILRATQKILMRAIEAKGSSIADFIYAVPGEKNFATGAYQKEFLVYSRQGLPCKKCSAPIVLLKQGGRSTYFCPHCQQ